MKLSDYVIDFLVQRGVNHVFFLPGGAAMHLNDSLGKRRQEIAFIPMLHEQAVSIATEAYAKSSQQLGVAMVTSGPAGTNALTGVVGAWLDSTACIFLSGQVKRADLKQNPKLRQLGSQEVDITTIVSSVTKHAITITDPKSIRYHLEKAFYLAHHGRPGPVWLDFPLDVQAHEIAPETLETFVLPCSGEKDLLILKKKVHQVLEMLQAAERPIIVAGNGIRIANAIPEFHELVDLVGAPVLTTWPAMDLLPHDHPLFAGRPGIIAPRGANFTLQNSDLMIVIGSRLDMFFTGYAHQNMARGAKKVMVDIDEEEIKKMQTEIHLPIVDDARSFILEFLDQIKKMSSKPHGRFDAWVKRVQEWKKKYPLVQPEHRQVKDRISLYYFSEIISQELPEGALVAPGSSGVAIELFLLNFAVKKGQRVFHNRGLGSMGFALPSAIGACLAAGNKETICVDGDGGFQMNVQELALVAQWKLPIKIFVLNNDGYASIRTSQQNYFKQLVGADSSSGLALPDLQKIAAAYEIPAVRLENHENLALKIRSVLATPGPVICEVMVLPEEERVPRLSSMQRPDGSMVSKPLEDLWPFLDRQEFLSNMIVPALEEK
ncbi:MAG: thiamine pyrophosphate-binding protein [Chthoniobacterales bacterium]|nr:thiamine pyrophosphate-binding protein [Chthoniobacterales bacterium]